MWDVLPLDPPLPLNPPLLVQKSHLHIAVSIPLSSRVFIIQKAKKGGGGGGRWFKLKLLMK